MSNWLSNERVVRLTGKKRYTAQRRVLTEMGIRFTPAATGEPLVSEDLSNPAKARKRNEPRWELLNG